MGETMKLTLIKGLLLLTVVGLCCSQAFSQTDNVQVKKDVIYATHDGVQLAGDLYIPAGGGQHPAIMFMHGGGFRGGSKSSYNVTWGPYLAAHGYVVFSIDYRLSKPNEPTWPQAFLDCKAALQYLRGNAAALGIDPDRIAVS